MINVAVIPGDGIGTEVVPAAVSVLEAAARRFGFEFATRNFDYGADRYLADGTTFPDDERLAIAREFDAILLGAIGDPRVPDMAHGRDIILGTRRGLDLYVNLRPIRAVADHLVPLKGRTAADIDFTIFRENTEGLYVGAGGVIRKGTPDEVAIQESVNTRKGVERIIRAAFRFADERQLPRVCMSDKNNAMRYAGDLWWRTFHEVAAEFPGIEAHHLFVDVLAMELVRRPQDFSVIVTSNLFGDIVSDLGAALQGGLGLACSANLNPDSGFGLFEPVHGSAPDIAGRGVANPMATILSGALMLDHLGQREAARAIDAAVSQAIAERAVTPDLGGTLSTAETARQLAHRIESH